MQEASNINLVLKVLLIGHGYLFFTQTNKFSGVVLLLTFIVLISGTVGKVIDSFIMTFAKKVGSLVLDGIFIFSYITVIVPLSIFRSREKESETTLTHVEKSQINFRRPW